MSTITLDQYLKIRRCPHCSIANPSIEVRTNAFVTHSDDGSNPRTWIAYACNTCGGVVTASSNNSANIVSEMYPETLTVNDVLPLKVKSFLQQAIDSTFAPSGSIMLCASAVDSMLKEKSYKDGGLYTRINKAITDGILTSDMGTWAHQVRLDANDERHADDEATLPTAEDAKQTIEFTKTLAELLFVLPSKVTKGIAASAQSI